MNRPLDKKQTPAFRVLKAVNFIFLFLVIGFLGPKEIKEPIPELWGFLEGKTGFDMIGFWFTPLWGNGRCRIENAKIALDMPGTRKIVFGMVAPPNAKPYPHLWAIDGVSTVLDTVCPMTESICQSRWSFATIDPISLKVETMGIINKMDAYHIKWGQTYLKGLKKAL